MLVVASLAPAPSHAAPPLVEVAGPPRFFAGEAAQRRLSGVPDTSSPITWHLVVHGAEVARGGLEPARLPGPPTLALRAPAVVRRMPADLLVLAGGRLLTNWAVEIVPDPSQDVVAAAGADAIGWLGPSTSLPRRLTRAGLRIEALESPGAVSRFQGRLLVMAPGPWGAQRFVQPLLSRVRDGARVLAFGPDDAPWVDPVGTPRYEPVDAMLVAGWGRAPIAGWNGDGTVARGSLRPPAGNHADLVADGIRETYLGRGTMTFVCLPVLEHVDDDPFALTLLARLFDRARQDPPALASPRAVLDQAGGRLASIFGATRGDGPVVEWDTGAVAPNDAAGTAPRLLVGLRRSVATSPKSGRDGPGLDDLPGFLRFATQLGVRVDAELPWSPP